MRNHKTGWTLGGILARVLETVVTCGVNLVVRYIRKKLGRTRPPAQSPKPGRKEPRR